jgi:hypothetical protein
MKRFELSRHRPVMVATAILKVARDLYMGKISTAAVRKNRDPFLPCATSEGMGRFSLVRGLRACLVLVDLQGKSLPTKKNYRECFGAIWLGGSAVAIL